MHSGRRPEIPQVVLQQWKLEGRVESLGNGLINDTYRVDEAFVLQRINSTVFINPRAVVSNYRKVFPALAGLVPRILPTVSGEWFVEDEYQDVWRLFDYCPGHNFPTLPNELCYFAGHAVGRMLNRVQNQTVALAPVIDKFHELDHYLDELASACLNRPRCPELDAIDEIRKWTTDYDSRVQIIHGDCKVDNLIFDTEIGSESSVRVRIVDLDTVMWGHPAWDFGDLLRSIVTAGSETQYATDDRKNRLKDVCRGFFEEFSLSETMSIKEFVRAPVHMSLMLAARFLTDHYRGNQYFKTSFPGENLERAREQLKLARWFREQQACLYTTVLSKLPPR